MTVRWRRASAELTQSSWSLPPAGLFCSAFGIAATGRMPITSGRTPATLKLTKRASGSGRNLDRLFEGQHAAAPSLIRVSRCRRSRCCRTGARCGTPGAALARWAFQRGVPTRAFVGVGQRLFRRSHCRRGRAGAPTISYRGDLVPELSGGDRGDRLRREANAKASQPCG